jgi:hypothetical protein
MVRTRKVEGTRARGFVIQRRGFNRCGIAALGAAIAAACFASAAVAAPRSSHGSGSGLWLVTATGRVEALGGAPALSAAASWTRLHVVIAAAGTASSRGLWLLSLDGSVLPVGDAASFGPAPVARSLAGRAVGIAATPDGGGYLVAYADGRVAAAGDAVARGVAIPPRGDGHAIAAIAITPTGQGYWLVGVDGHVYAFGDAPALGQTFGPFAGGAVTAVASTPTGRGLWIGSADGDVAVLGDAVPFPPASRRLRGLLTGLAPTTSGRGLWLAGLTGSVEARGDAAPLAPAGIVAPVVAAVSAAPAGTLTVNVTDLPPHAAGAVTVSGSGTPYAVPATETLRVAAGDYAVAASAVHAAGTTYRPTITGSPATVAPGGSATATVDYLWAIPDTTKNVAAAAVEAATGDPATGLTLTLNPASVPALAVGNIVVVGITAATPNGWLGKVTSLQRNAGTLIVTTTPAPLTEAFARGKIDAHWGGAGGNTITDGLGATSGRTTQARARSQDLLGPIGAQIPNNLRCNGSAYVSLDGGVEIDPDVEVIILWSLSTQPIKRLEVTSRIVATATAGFAAGAAADCTLDPTSLAEVTIPLEAPEVPFTVSLVLDLDVSAGISVGAAVSTSATETESALFGGTWTPDDGLTLQHRFESPTFTDAPPNPSANADAWVKIGPRATILFDDVVGPYFDVDAGVDLSADTSQAPWWTLDGTLDADLGLSVPHVHDFGSFNLFSARFPLEHATKPPPTGGGTGGDGGGDGGGGGGGNPPPAPFCDVASAPFPLTPGDSMQVEGHDFAPNETVAFALDAAGGSSLGTASADSTGFVSGTVTIPSNAAGGDHVIVATGAAGKDECSVFVNVYTGPPPGSATAGADDGADAGPLASSPRTVEQLDARSPSWPHLPADVLPGDALVVVTTRSAPTGWTIADTEGSTVVFYRFVPLDPSTIDLSALGSGAIVTVVRDVDPSDPVTGHSSGAMRVPGEHTFTTGFTYVFDDPAFCPFGVTPPCAVAANPTIIQEAIWGTPSVGVLPGQGVLGWETLRNSSEALAYASCANVPTLTCPYPAWGYTGALSLGGSTIFPVDVVESPDVSGFDQIVGGPNGDRPADGPMTATGDFDGALFCEPVGPYPYDEGTTAAAVDAPRDAAGDPQACETWMASPASLGAIVLNPRPAGTNPADTVPPTRPGHITAAVGATEVDLSWQPSTDNTGVVGYAVFRGNTWIATVTDTSFSDGDLTPFTAYHYSVVALDGFGNHSGGATMDVVTQLAGGGGGGGGGA